MAELSGRVSMLDPNTLTSVGRPAELDEPACCVSAGPDNHTAVVLTGFQDPSGFRVGSGTGWAMVDLESGVVLHRGQLGFDGTQVSFSPDGQHAAISGSDGEVLVLDTDNGDPLRSPVVGHHAWVDSLTYSPDGSRILTAANDGTVGLWEGETGQLLAHVEIPQRPIAAEFGEDPDSVIVAPLWEGPVYEWDTRVDHAVEFACRVAGRDFTEAEWVDHFPDRPYQETCPS